MLIKRISKATKLQKLILAALFAAITCVATMIIRIPSYNGGYVNLGDGAVILSGALLGPIGALSAALGSFLADFFAGYGIYAPATAIIKGLMAIWMFFSIKALDKKINLKVAFILSAIVAEVIMILGYFIFEIFLLGISASAMNALANAFQGVAGIVSSTAIFLIINRRI